MVPVNDEDQQPSPTYGETKPSDAPPTISMPSTSTSSALVPALPLAPSTNFLTIVRDDSIKGGYTIDPSMRVPPGAVPSIGDDGEQLNMRAASQNGSIELVIAISRSGDTKRPAQLQADARNGHVNVTVHDNRQNRFRLKVTSKNGAVSVRIPPTFVGTVSTSFKNGSLTFSQGIQARLMTFSEQDKQGRHFIGDYPSSGYEGDETWLGDHLRIETEKGRIRLDFADEESEESSHGNVLLKFFGCR